MIRGILFGAAIGYLIAMLHATVWIEPPKVPTKQEILIEHYAELMKGLDPSLPPRLPTAKPF